VGRSSIPIARVGNGDGSLVVNNRRDEHGLVAGEHGLAPGHLALALVNGLDSSSARNTIRLVWKWLLDLAVLVTVQSTVHSGRGAVVRVGVPLGHDHARLAGNGAVHITLARLVGAHCPSGVLLVGRDGNEVGIVCREGTVTGALLHRRGRSFGPLVVVLVLVSQTLLKMMESLVVSRGIAKRCGLKQQGRPEGRLDC
jgi:hypothetical protein